MSFPTVHTHLPVLALVPAPATEGGPELAAKALAVATVRALCRPIVVGDPEEMALAAGRLHLGIRVRAIDTVEDARFEVDEIDVLAPPDEGVAAGDVLTAGDRGAARAARLARLLVQQRVVDAIAAGSLALLRPDPLTETVVELAGRLRVAHVSAGLGLREALERLDRDRVLRTIERAAALCQDLGMGRPRVGVLAVNPGELPGVEEREVLQPAVEAAAAAGIAARLVSEDAFLQALEGLWDVLVAPAPQCAAAALALSGARARVQVVMGDAGVCTAAGQGAEPAAASRDPAQLVAAVQVAARLANARQIRQA